MLLMIVLMAIEGFTIFSFLRIQAVFIHDIEYIEIVSGTTVFMSFNNHHGNLTREKHYILNIYKKNKDIISINLSCENMGDIKQIVDIINSRSIRYNKTYQRF